MSNPADVIRKFIDERAEVASKATKGPFSIERRDADYGSINYIIHGAADFAWCLDELDRKAKFNAAFIADARNSASKWEAIAREMLGALEMINRMEPYNPHVGTDPRTNISREALSKCARILSGETE